MLSQIIVRLVLRNSWIDNGEREGCQVFQEQVVRSTQLEFNGFVIDFCNGLNVR
ncbi:hypothetical protein D3C78_1905600 [compost metagenome]